MDYYKRWGWYATICDLSESPTERDYWWTATYIETLNELARRKEKAHVEAARISKRHTR